MNLAMFQIDFFNKTYPIPGRQILSIPQCYENEMEVLRYTDIDVTKSVSWGQFGYVFHHKCMLAH